MFGFTFKGLNVRFKWKTGLTICLVDKYLPFATIIVVNSGRP